MKKLDEILQELGIPKVKLAKYLGVSRQMIYNYLDLKSINDWPKDKKALLLKLLGLEDGSPAELNKIKITPDYITEVESKLNMSIKNTFEFDNMAELRNLPKEEQQLFSDITYIIKDKITEDYNHEENIAAITYIYHILQSLDNVKEVKYFIAYISKLTGFSDPNEFKFNEDRQFIFEGITHSAITLYTNGGASKSKVIESHMRFVQDIERKKEEVLSRTQQLNATTFQALRELGYSKFTADNYSEVLEKIAEIESRKV